MAGNFIGRNYCPLLEVFMFICRFIFAVLISAAFIGHASACPDYRLSGEVYQLTGDQLWSPKMYNVRAGGSINIRDCPNVRPRTDQGRGFVVTRPDFTFNLSRMERYSLVVSVVSECDSVLLLNTGSASWYYDDDDNGNLDAKVILNSPSNGWLDVWIGTYNGDYCDAMLKLETFNR